MQKFVLLYCETLLLSWGPHCSLAHHGHLGGELKGMDQWLGGEEEQCADPGQVGSGTFQSAIAPVWTFTHKEFATIRCADSTLVPRVLSEHLVRFLSLPLRMNAHGS